MAACGFVPPTPNPNAPSRDDVAVWLKGLANSIGKEIKHTSLVQVEKTLAIQAYEKSERLERYRKKEKKVCIEHNAECRCCKTCFCKLNECNCLPVCCCPAICSCPESCTCPTVCLCPPECCNCPALCTCPITCNCPKHCSCPPTYKLRQSDLCADAVCPIHEGTGPDVNCRECRVNTDIGTTTQCNVYAEFNIDNQPLDNDCNTTPTYTKDPIEEARKADINVLDPCKFLPSDSIIDWDECLRMNFNNPLINRNEPCYITCKAPGDQASSSKKKHTGKLPETGLPKPFARQ